MALGLLLASELAAVLEGFAAAVLDADALLSFSFTKASACWLYSSV